MLPYFYNTSIDRDTKALTLDEATSKHCVQVLRMEDGDQLLLTNGKGVKATCTITMAQRKHCQVKVDEIVFTEARSVKLSVAIAFTKNNSRNEWFLEKATELGIEHIYPVITARTEKDKLKPERLEQILVSAMLQSQQVYLPQLHEALSFKKFVAITDTDTSIQKMIAHCMEGEDKKGLLKIAEPGKDLLILIGPEGDFTSEEVSLCTQHSFVPVSLGDNRLRTETAALYSCVAFNALNYG